MSTVTAAAAVSHRPARPHRVALARRPAARAARAARRSPRVLNLWALSRNGFANEYYSAAVRSMSTSWHAFLYGSFDQGGVMTVDKPPLALWVQALSVRAFGFSLVEHARAAGADGRRDGRA